MEKIEYEGFEFWEWKETPVKQIKVFIDRLNEKFKYGSRNPKFSLFTENSNCIVFDIFCNEDYKNVLFGGDIEKVISLKDEKNVEDISFNSVSYNKTDRVKARLIITLKGDAK